MRFGSSPRTLLGWAVLLCLAVAWGCGGGGGAETEAQVARGDEVYGSTCAACHGAEGEGGTGPAILGAGAPLRGYQTAQGLFDYVSRVMPFDDPGSLSDEEYWDVVAFLLNEQDLLDEGEGPVSADTADQIILGRDEG